MAHSIGYARLLCEIAKERFFTRHDADYFFAADKASEVIVEMLSEMTGIPVVHDYSKATINTVVVKGFISDDMRFAFPKVKVFGLIVKKGVKHDFAVITGCNQDVVWEWEVEQGKGTE